MMTLKNVVLALACSSLGIAQVTIPDGTKLRVRLDQPLSSGHAEVGQTIELTVAEAVKIGSAVVIGEGARVTGTITEAVPKRRMGRAGKLDFSIDRVAAADGQWVPIRYTIQKKAGQSHGVRTGIITAGVAVAFWPAAPVVLLMKGKDVTINKGVSFDVFTDTAHIVALPAVPGDSAKQQAVAAAPPLENSPANSPAPAALPAAGSASVTVTASAAGADIEINGAFVGNTPTTLQLPSGNHQVTVKHGGQSWTRTIQVTNGSTVSLHAALASGAPVAQTR